MTQIINFSYRHANEIELEKAKKYENKIKDLFKQRKRRKSKSKASRSLKSLTITRGGKKSHKNRTRKHRK